MKQDWDKEAEYFGNTGLNNCAVAAANVAMWDAWGHAAEYAVWKILGSNAKRFLYMEVVVGSVIQMKNY